MKTSTFLPVVMALVAQVAATPVDKVEKRDFTIPGICNLGQWGVSLDLNKLCKESVRESFLRHHISSQE